MQTIYQTAKPFDQLLKKQKMDSGQTYRPMHYVVELTVNEGLLLYHTMTKALLLLTPDEAEVYKTSPTSLPHLVEQWFLVPQNHDDRLLSRQIRDVAKMLEKTSDAITDYTIMTTTDCNARCFYCFEMGHPRIPMSEETARRTVDYIIQHSKGEKVTVMWYGGDPLYNKGIITYISQLLTEAGVDFKSKMISNGYLFDDDVIAEACSLWRLKRVQITLDGTEEVYNRCKAYIYKEVNAYHRVIDNIHRLQKADVQVIIRLNIDMHNADDLLKLAAELRREFPDPEGIHVYLHQLFEEEKGRTAIHDERKRKIVFGKMLEIRNILSDGGFIKTVKLRRTIRTNNCMADHDSCITITPSGNIGKCDHYTHNLFVSHIDQEEWDEKMLQSFRETIDEIEACATCFDYPNCIILKRCQSTHHCFPEVCMDNLDKLKRRMLIAYENYTKEEKSV
jgi:radical SAM protein with 4Fe4S-binding SPASM domain